MLGEIRQGGREKRQRDHMGQHQPLEMRQVFLFFERNSKVQTATSALTEVGSDMHEHKSLKIVLRLPDRETDTYRQRARQNDEQNPHGLITRRSPRLKCVIFLGTVPSPPPGNLHSSERLLLLYPPLISYLRASQPRGIKITIGNIPVQVQLAWLITNVTYLLFFFHPFYSFSSGVLFPLKSSCINLNARFS